MSIETEAINPATRDLDQLPTKQLVEAMHRADQEALAAVTAILPDIERGVEAIAQTLSEGGRLFYIGAGTSGRLGVLDASECPPTFNTPPELVQGVIAGGDAALRNAIEGAEDDKEAGGRDLRERGFSGHDILVAIAASGSTPYVIASIEFARSLGAMTLAITSVQDSPAARAADLALVPRTGAEVVSGSTRLKAGTATKMILNMLSTGAMVKLGHVHGNLMVNVKPTNRKLQERAVRLIASLAEVRLESAAKLLEQGGSVRVAVLMQHFEESREEAEQRLAAAGGRLRRALAG